MKPVFGFDLDGVLYPWAKAAYEYIKYRELNDLPFAEFWIREIRGESPHTKLFWENIVLIKSIYEMYSAKKEDVETLCKLSKSFTIYYITHRAEELRFVTNSWLRRYNFPDADNLIHTTDKKEIAVRAYNCSYYVEDRPTRNLQYVTRLFVPRLPYNENLESSFKQATFIDTIPEILENL